MGTNRYKLRCELQQHCEESFSSQGHQELARRNLKLGESTVVEFKVGFEELKYWSEAANSWQLPSRSVAASP